MPTPTATGVLPFADEGGLVVLLQITGSTWGMKPNGAARDCGSRFRGFDFLRSLQGFLRTYSQLLEKQLNDHRTCSCEAEISKLSGSTK